MKGTVLVMKLLAYLAPTAGILLLNHSCRGQRKVTHFSQFHQLGFYGPCWRFLSSVVLSEIQHFVYLPYLSVLRNTDSAQGSLLFLLGTRLWNPHSHSHWQLPRDPAFHEQGGIFEPWKEEKKIPHLRETEKVTAQITWVFSALWTPLPVGVTTRCSTYRLTLCCNYFLINRWKSYP